MTDKPKRRLRKRCDECNELTPPDELELVAYDVWDDASDENVVCHMLMCEGCREALDEPDYGIYGDREDQIPYDSAMYRD